MKEKDKRPGFVTGDREQQRFTSSPDQEIGPGTFFIWAMNSYLMSRIQSHGILFAALQMSGACISASLYAFDVSRSFLPRTFLWNRIAVTRRRSDGVHTPPMLWEVRAIKEEG